LIDNFKFSIIMPIFNSERYLEKSIESIINQDMNFNENIQLILINDESEDNSEKIILKYKKEYPENILILNQPHSGYIAARNLGLSHATGKYLHFLDSDDYLDKTALSNVYSFFESNEDEIDVVSIPVKFFEKTNKNSKLNIGLKDCEIINLINNPNHPQMYFSSCFFKRDCFENEIFENNLIFSEDTLLLNKILSNKSKFGFVPQTTYHHRKKIDLTNFSEEILFKKEFYQDKFQYYFKLIEYSENKFSEISQFIQYTIIYDLLNIIDKIKMDIFNKDEIDGIINNIKELLKNIEDNIILNNEFIENENLKSFLMYFKKGNVNYELHPFNVSLKFDDYHADELNRHKFWLDYVNINEDYVNISGFVDSLFNFKDISVVAVVEKDGKYSFITGNPVKNHSYKNTSFLSKDWSKVYAFTLKIKTENLIGCKFRLRFDFHKDGDKYNNKKDNLIFTYLPIDFTHSCKMSLSNQTLSDKDITLKLDGKYWYVTKNYKFSVIMAIYNTEEYVGEAIESIINQTIGFEENIQLILINDGSEDESEKILLKYQDQYPENILVISQENQGQAKARNNGLKFIRGKYVNFLDSDDLLMENTMEEVYKFFEKNYNKTDVVSIPMTSFGRMESEHKLNYKYEKSRVIDLNKEPNNPQLSASSSFIKNSAIKNIKFPTNITGSEDAQFINKILLNNSHLGVLNSTKYLYRRRSDSSSTLDTMSTDEKYYTIRLKNHFMALIQENINKKGKIPKFLQYTLIYDLHWLIAETDIEIFDNNIKKAEFMSYIHNILNYIDDDVILNNKNISNELLKKYIYYLKTEEINTKITKNNVTINIKNRQIDKLTNHNLWLDIVEIKNNYLNISGFLNSHFNSKFISIDGVKNNGHETEYYPSKYVKYTSRKDVVYLTDKWQYKYNFDLKIPLKENERCKIKIKVNYHKDGNLNNFNEDNLISTYLKIKLNKHTRLSELSNYIIKSDLILTFENDKEFYIEPYSYKAMRKYEKEVRQRIKESKRYGYQNALNLRWIYTALYPLYRKFYKDKEIYIFEDRLDVADDNSMHLFKYAQKINDNVKKYFVVSKESEDYKKLKKIGKVLALKSNKHKLLYLFADKVISTHPYESGINPFFEYDSETDTRSLFDGLVTCDIYFLQHGVSKDNISDWMSKYNHNLSLLATVSDKERESFFVEGYNFDKDIIQTLGFPRFDNLRNSPPPKKQILIIPTWRKYLRGNKNLFMNSDYFNNLNNLINNKELIEMANKYGYSIKFKAHPELENFINDTDEKYIDLFNIPKEVTLSTDEDYQTLFKESSLLITDYSSVFFDFAYMEKPIIYYHPSDDYHYEGSYFDYETMGFGAVINDENNLKTKIEEYISSDCSMEDKYKKRVEDFFKYIDSKNCERVYNWIHSH